MIWEFPLHTPRGYNRSCGPTVMSILLGITTDEAAKIIRQMSPHRKMVRGMHRNELLAALELHGWNRVVLPPFAKSVGTLLKEQGHYQPGLYLLTTYTHFIVLRKRTELLQNDWECCDNQTKGIIRLREHARYLNRRIQSLTYLLPPLR